MNINSFSEIETVFFRDTAYSFIKAFLIKEITNASLLPENLLDKNFFKNRAYILTHRFSLEQLISELPENQQILLKEQNKEFQIFLNELHWLLLHHSPQKYFLASQVLSSIFQHLSFQRIIKQECWEAVQFYRYVNQVKKEYFVLSQTKAKDLGNHFYMYQINTFHHLDKFLIRLLSQKHPESWVLFECSGEKTLVHQEWSIPIPSSLKIEEPNSLEQLLDYAQMQIQNREIVPLRALALSVA